MDYNFSSENESFDLDIVFVQRGINKVHGDGYFINQHNECIHNDKLKCRFVLAKIFLKMLIQTLYLYFHFAMRLFIIQNTIQWIMQFLHIICKTILTAI